MASTGAAHCIPLIAKNSKDIQQFFRHCCSASDNEELQVGTIVLHKECLIVNSSPKFFGFQSIHSRNKVNDKNEIYDPPKCECASYAWLQFYLEQLKE
jgi:hypothetical protein